MSVGSAGCRVLVDVGGAVQTPAPRVTVQSEEDSSERDDEVRRAVYMHKHSSCNLILYAWCAAGGADSGNVSRRTELSF